MTAYLDDLERLERLRTAGALSDSEFQAEKAALLGRSEDPSSYRPRLRLVVGILIAAFVLLAAAVAAFVIMPAPKRSADVPTTPVPAPTATSVAATEPAATSAMAGTVDEFSLPSTPTAVVQLNCHMDECTWQQITALAVVSADNRGTLVKVDSRVGTSEHSPADGDNEYPASYDPKIKISWEVQTTYMLCSKQHPAEISAAGDETWSASFLNLVNPIGAEDAAVNSYMLVCHNQVPGSWTADSVRNRGYLDQDGDEVALTKPEDLLTKLNRQ